MSADCPVLNLRLFSNLQRIINLRAEIALGALQPESAESLYKCPTTFRQHFSKSDVTNPPMQYQKQLRLQESRRLLLSVHMDASSVSVRIRYDNASQYSREYARLCSSCHRYATSSKRAAQQ